jgi:small subunit ribosomal protein S18
MVELPDEVKNMAVTPEPKPERSGERHGSGGRGPGRGPGAGGGFRRGPGGERGERPGGRGRGGDAMEGEGGRRPFQRRRRRLFGSGKVCQLCVRKIEHVDYKDLDQLKFFVSSQGKILPRRMSGACSRHQRMITTAIKRARHIALLPFKA